MQRGFFSGVGDTYFGTKVGRYVGFGGCFSSSSSSDSSSSESVSYSLDSWTGGGFIIGCCFFWIELIFELIEIVLLLLVPLLLLHLLILLDR